MKEIIRAHRQLYIAAGGIGKYYPGMFQTATVDDETGILMPLSLTVGLLKNVDATTCEPWCGKMFPNGYGRLGGSTAHRATWNVRVSSIPDSLEVAHLCGNRACVAPRHLYLASRWTNEGDKTRDGSVARGSRNGGSKLSEEQVIAIRERYATGDWTQKELGKQFGVSQKQVSPIVRGQTYTEVGGPLARKTRRGPRPIVDRDAVRKLVGQLSMPKIAKALGCGQRTVSRITADLKLDTRPIAWFSATYPELEGYTPDQWLRLAAGCE